MAASSLLVTLNALRLAQRYSGRRMNSPCSSSRSASRCSAWPSAPSSGRCRGRSTTRYRRARHPRRRRTRTAADAEPVADRLRANPMAPDWLVLGGALLSGAVYGGAHCAAMCGGIATGSRSVRADGGRRCTQPGRVAGVRPVPSSAASAVACSASRACPRSASRCARRSAHHRWSSLVAPVSTARAASRVSSAGLATARGRVCGCCNDACCRRTAWQAARARHAVGLDVLRPEHHPAGRGWLQASAAHGATTMLSPSASARCR